MQIQSKLPNVGTTIFTVMSGLANEVGAINLSQGFPNYNTAQRLQELVTEVLINTHQCQVFCHCGKKLPVKWNGCMGQFLTRNQK